MLTDDLQAADKHVDQIRLALIGLNKRLGNLPNQTMTQDSALKEKRLVKLIKFLYVIIIIFFNYSL